ncbi:MAG TPA: hypothetical protein VJT73_00110 [Polyangiaceae bacterium]|nr:hypothetical protein [Polyangiaceae bacterium]
MSARSRWQKVALGFWLVGGNVAGGPLGCGAGAAPSGPAKTGGDDALKAEGSEVVEMAGQPAASASRVQCDDGSCFSCGEALCLAGFYCSASKAGHGCAWTPSCGAKASCACLKAALRDEPSCSCQEREGGVFVTCDGAKL